MTFVPWELPGIGRPHSATFAEAEPWLPTVYAPASGVAEAEYGGTILTGYLFNKEKKKFLFLAELQGIMYRLH